MREDAEAERAIDRALALAGEGDRLVRERRPRSANRAHRDADLLMRFAEDRRQAPSLTLPEPDDGFIEIPRITRPALAAWLYRTPTGLTEADLDAHLSRAERDELEAAFRALVHSYHDALAANDMTRPAELRAAARDRARRDRDLLGTVLKRGLRHPRVPQLAGTQRSI